MSETPEQPTPEPTYEELRELVHRMFDDMPGQKEDVQGPIVTGELD
jgi:hypothetical protein